MQDNSNNNNIGNLIKKEADNNKSNLKTPPYITVRLIYTTTTISNCP